MLGAQFALTARFKKATAPFGIDLLYFFHRDLAVIAWGLVAVHAVVLLATDPARVGSLDPRSAPLALTLGSAAFLLFGAALVTSLWRKALHIEYDRWRRGHVALAVLGVAAAGLHVHGSVSVQASPLRSALWTGLGVAWIGLVAYVRGVRPWRLRRNPYRVVEVRKERGRSHTLALEPERPPPLAYRAGQFAWLTLRASPFALREHPFSFASSPTRPGRLEFTIKALGDFTDRIGEIEIGEIAYVDGPYGAFGVDRLSGAPGFVFAAGGVGIAPVMSVLRALADGEDRRPLWLFYGNRRWDRVVFREELDALAGRLDLRVIHVLLEPPSDWQGERGYIDRAVLERHLPPEREGLHYLTCGPTPMLRLVERSLRELGVPLRMLHSEIFDLV